MPANEQETFLVILQSQSWCKAFLFQGTYEQAYKLPHDMWDVHLYLLAQETGQTSWNQWGAPLLHVDTLRNVHLASELARASAFSLSRLAPQQRLRELQEIRSMLDKEEADTKRDIEGPSVREVAEWVARELFDMKLPGT